MDLPSNTIVAILVCLAGCSGHMLGPVQEAQDPSTLHVRVSNQLDDGYLVEKIEILAGGKSVLVAEATTMDGQTVPALEPSQDRTMERQLPSGETTIEVEAKVEDLQTGKLHHIQASERMELPPRQVAVEVTLVDGGDGSVPDVWIRKVPLELLMKGEKCVEPDLVTEEPDC